MVRHIVLFQFFVAYLTSNIEYFSVFLYFVEIFRNYLPFIVFLCRRVRSFIHLDF